MAARHSLSATEPHSRAISSRRPIRLQTDSLPAAVPPGGGRSRTGSLLEGSSCQPAAGGRLFYVEPWPNSGICLAVYTKDRRASQDDAIRATLPKRARRTE